MDIIHLVAGAAVELLLVLVQVCDLKFSSTLVAFEAVLLENSNYAFDAQTVVDLMVRCPVSSHDRLHGEDRSEATWTSRRRQSLSLSSHLWALSS